MPDRESSYNSTLSSDRLVNNLAQAKSRRREPVRVEIMRDLSLGESICFSPAAGRGTFSSTKGINFGLSTFLKRVCIEVHVSVIGLLLSASVMLQRPNLVNCGDDVITAVICSLQ